MKRMVQGGDISSHRQVLESQLDLANPDFSPVWFVTAFPPDISQSPIIILTPSRQQWFSLSLLLRSPIIILIPSKQPRLSLSSLRQSTIIILIPSSFQRGSNYFSALIRECRVCVSIIRILNSKCVQLLDCHQDHFWVSNLLSQMCVW